MNSLATDPLRIVSGDFVAAALEAASLPPPRELEIAFVGRSNVGKSSLLNTLCLRRSLFRTSSTPGCTRQLIFFAGRTHDRAHVTLVDVPGYGYAQRSKTERKQWAESIEAYLRGRPTLAAVALLIDARREIEAEERDLLELLDDATVSRPKVAVVAVATKLDKLQAARRASALQTLRRELGAPSVGFSTRLAETHAPVWRAIRNAAGLGRVPEG